MSAIDDYYKEMQDIARLRDVASTVRDVAGAARGALTDAERAILDKRLGLNPASDDRSPLVAAKHEAERRLRGVFQNKFGAFWKCPRCGAYLGSSFERNFPGATCYLKTAGGESCGGVAMETVGYAPPSRRL